jgi:flagellar biosynthetic protein FliR
MLFLAAGGHQVLLGVLHRSYAAFPVGATPDISAMAQTVLVAGAEMLALALRVAAPLLAASLILAVALAILAKAMPEANVLYLSFPLRVGLCVMVAAAMMPYLNSFAGEMAGYMRDFLAG